MEECIRSLTRRSRSTRRFKEDQRLSESILRDLVDIARLCPSARNRQPLKYILSVEPEETAQIRSCLLWALDLPDWDGPEIGERPPAYIIIVAPKGCTPDPSIDLGIAAQTILLAAAEIGISGCLFGSIKRSDLSHLLRLPEGYEILLVMALGYPAEEIRIESPGPDGDIRYWRSSDGIHHVPKRSVDDCILRRTQDTR
ncbi:nitroreductase family protein [Methanocalculus sp.]|uniref:nitroreductase family protein n=1 Tax=Methanocalculus sp. TaxID=2004547 RepID=UPI00271AEC51|nr:nitroreductase family protein [Methanocalculus sp.]MDO8842109.1 nitroreductase family protein [Methanocalculus sp.]